MQVRKLASCVALAIIVASGVASAQNEKERAKDAYEHGVEAHKRGDFQRAAEDFARADAIAPSPVALQAALDEAVLADDPAIGSDLVERSQRAPATGGLAKSIEAAKKKFAGRAGRMKIGCPDGSSCLATLDGAAVAVGKPVWSRAGQHTVVVQVDGEAQTKLVDVKADQTVDVTPVAKSAQVVPPPPPPPSASTATPPPPPPPPPPPRNDHPDAQPPRDVAKSGLPPVVFWAGAGVTVLLADTGIAGAFVTKSKHDDFVKNGCESAPNAGCKDTSDSGQTLQIVTDGAFAAAALAGVATIVIGVAFTDWNAKGLGGTPQVTPIAGGAIGGWGGRF